MTTPTGCLYLLTPRSPHRVARMAKTHQVVEVEPLIRRVGHLGDVVNIGSRNHALHLEAIRTQRVHSQPQIPNLAPRYVVAALVTAASVLVSLSAMVALVLGAMPAGGALGASRVRAVAGGAGWHSFTNQQPFNFLTAVNPHGVMRYLGARRVCCADSLFCVRSPQG